MDIFVEVEFDDGLVRHWEFPRASVVKEATVEVDTCFNDLSNGLMVTVRHHSEPESGSDVCRVVKDYRLSLVPPEDMSKLMVCRYCGDERLVRYRDGIVNLTKLKQLSRLYCGDEGTAGLLSDIYATSKALEQAHQGITNEEMADLLGVSLGMLEEAQAAGFIDEDMDFGEESEDWVPVHSGEVGEDLASQAFGDAED